MHFCSFVSKLERCKPHNGARHPTKYGVINDVTLLPTVYHKIYCRIFDVIQSEVSLQKPNALEFPYNFDELTSACYSPL